MGASRPSAHLDDRHLSCVALELWEPGGAKSRQHPRSCRCTGSVATSRSSARLNRTHLHLITTGHVHHFVLALHWSISINLLDLLGGGHCICTTGCRASPRHELRLAVSRQFSRITAHMISTVFGIFLMVGIRFCIAGSSP